ncbi:hypothetical protein OAJ23_02390 [Pelagibacteraceae bacterium]|nr:hypothetical protein [Pelagibacteraceae bacterium]
MSEERSLDYSTHDYDPLNKFIDEQSKIRRSRTLWQYAKVMSLFLVGLGVFLILLGIAYWWFTKPHPEIVNVNYIPQAPEQPYTPDESWMDDETDTSQNGSDKTIVTKSVTHFITVKSGSFNIITGYRYESSESLRSGNKYDSKYCYLTNINNDATYHFNVSRYQVAQLKLMGISETKAKSYEKYCK